MWGVVGERPGCRGPLGHRSVYSILGDEVLDFLTVSVTLTMTDNTHFQFTLRVHI